MAHQGYGFCEFLTEEDAEYACKIMNQIKLWGKPIRVNKVRRRCSNLPPIMLKLHSSRRHCFRRYAFAQYN
jgi:RNA recognition motif-containing protein